MIGLRWSSWSQVVCIPAAIGLETRGRGLPLSWSGSFCSIAGIGRQSRSRLMTWPRRIQHSPAYCSTQGALVLHFLLHDGAHKARVYMHTIYMQAQQQHAPAQALPKPMQKEWVARYCNHAVRQHRQHRCLHAAMLLRSISNPAHEFYYAPKHAPATKLRS